MRVIAEEDEGKGKEGEKGGKEGEEKMQVRAGSPQEEMNPVGEATSLRRRKKNPW